MKYHLVWCPKYRRPVLVKPVNHCLKTLLGEKAVTMGLTIHLMEILPDQVHLCVEGDPTLCVSEIVAGLKSFTSHSLRQEFPFLRSQLSTLWSRSDSAGSVGSVSEAVIRTYSESQKGRDMFKAFKYRLEPGVNQTRELEIALETHRRLYNSCLEKRKTAYETEKKLIRYTEQSAWFKTERSVNPWFAKLNFSSAQATMRRLDNAFAAFFRRVKSGQAPGYPRFKGRDRFNSFTYPSIGDGARVIGHTLRLQHIGKVRINLHRPIEGIPKTIAVAREGGKWYVIVACEIESGVRMANELPAVGIDVGIESFLTASDGRHVPSLQPLQLKLRTLRVEQRSLARRKRGSLSRRKQRLRVASLHATVANDRRDHHHKIARDLVSRYGFIAVESLNIRGMSRNHWLARAVLDSGWGQFLTILQHKAEYAGVKVIEVNARGTSQTCPQCGAVAKKTLSQRNHSCGCGYSTHRDHAAAQVILSRGLAGMQPGDRNVDVGSHGLRSRLL